MFRKFSCSRCADWLETIWVHHVLDNNVNSRAGQDKGGSRSDTLTKNSKGTKLLHIVLCYTQDVVAYDPVLFGGMLPPTLTPLKVKPEALILISIWGRTLQCGVMYIFYVFVLQKLIFITNCGIGESKGLQNNTKNSKIVFFIFENKFEHVTSNTQFRLAQIRVAPFLHLMLQVCHRGKSSHRCANTL